ncbi:copper-binding protein [Variovorax ureilyticus]|uniref:copper-binding protein n=1 Tax=Variovorax ureilyticus TaxID=1836198 RepID=UPI003D67A1E5
MKNVTLATIVLALALPASSVFAQQKKDDMNGMEMKGMDMSKKPAASHQTIHTAKGVVKKIDAKAGMVTVAHEPVPSMNWPAMTMDFKVKDKALLDKFADGQNVEFEFAKEGKLYIVKSVK